MSKIDDRLRNILTKDVDTMVDGLPDMESEMHDAEPTAEDLKPVLYEQKSSDVQLESEDLREDYRAARSNLHGLMGKTNAALELALRFAQLSESPRALEVAATLIKTSADISKDMMSIQKEIKKDQKPPKEATQINIYNNKREERDIASYIDDLPEDDES